MEVIGGLVALLVLASYIGLVVDVRGVRMDQREHLDAILTELWRIRPSAEQPRRTDQPRPAPESVRDEAFRPPPAVR